MTAVQVSSRMKGLKYASMALDSMTWSDSISIPRLGRKDVLVRVASSSLNPFDFRVAESSPMMIAYSGKPVGCDVSGEVLKTGSQVEKFHAGESVYGWGHGLAEYAVVSSDQIAHVPKGMDPRMMGIYPCVATTAYQLLQKYWLAKRGECCLESLLIIGCSGGVGSSLIQLAREFGGSSLNIYGVCSKQHKNMCLEMGATKVFGYDDSPTDFNIGNILPPGSVELIVDTVSGTPECPNYAPVAHQLLKPYSGKYVTLNSLSPIEYLGARLMQTAHAGPLRKQHEFFVVERSNSGKDLEKIAQLIKEGKLKLPIEETVLMEENSLRKAFETLERRHMGGKLRVVAPE